jgi:hypothetical protein
LFGIMAIRLPPHSSRIADMMRTNNLYVSRCPRKSLKIGAPERSRTPNPQIRSLVLYPIELRARAEQPSGLRGLQIATPAGGGKQGGSKGRSEGVLHRDDHDSRIAKFISQISEPVG